MQIPDAMTAIVVPSPGGPEAMQVSTLPVPKPRDGEVLIRVAAAGVNAPDLAQRRGRYDPPPDASPHLGLEAAGEVVVPAGPWSVGDRVVALTNGGAYAQFVAVPHGQVLPLPRGWSFAEGAALPETFFTVTQTLVMRAKLEAGMTVLVHGASGGIGGAAILISRILGANAIGVVSSPGKAAYATGLGAFATIDRTREDFVARTLALTGGNGADRIVDIVGGATTARNIEASARFGHILLVSTAHGVTAELPIGRMLMNQLTLSASTLRPQTRETKAAIAARLRRDIWPALETGNVPKPRVRTFPLTEAIAAHRAMEDPGNFGKIVLSI